LQLEREITAWRLRVRGKSTQTIADQLGMTRQGVEAILARLERRELKKLSKRIARHKVTHHHRYEHVVEETFDAWHASKKPLKRAQRRVKGGVNVNPSGDDDDCQEEISSTEVTERTGDVNYLHTGMAAMKNQAQLWGLEVLPASQDQASSISHLSEDMQRRGEEYDAREAEEELTRDPAGTPPDGADRAPEVQDGPGPVQ
jgi:hypothetical protein